MLYAHIHNKNTLKKVNKGWNGVFVQDEPSMKLGVMELKIWVS